MILLPLSIMICSFIIVLSILWYNTTNIKWQKKIAIFIADLSLASLTFLLMILVLEVAKININ